MLTHLAGPLCFAGNHSRQSISASKSILCCKGRQAPFWLEVFRPSLNPVEMRLLRAARISDSHLRITRKQVSARNASAHAQAGTMHRPQTRSKGSANRNERKRKREARTGNARGRPSRTRRQAHGKAGKSHQKPAGKHQPKPPETPRKAPGNRRQTARKDPYGKASGPCNLKTQAAEHRAPQARRGHYQGVKQGAGEPPTPVLTLRARWAQQSLKYAAAVLKGVC